MAHGRATVTLVARPYIVRWRDNEGNEHDAHVVAYDLMEAIQSVALAVDARGDRVAKTVSITPDLEALEAMRSDDETRRGLEIARALGETREQ